MIVSYSDLLLNDEDEPYKEYEQNSVTPKNISYNNPLTHVGVWNKEEDYLKFIFKNGESTDSIGKDEEKWVIKKIPSFN